nr:Nif3-like dinuclear metal center hexameric protein [Marinilactibacillus kalidii]
MVEKIERFAPPYLAEDWDPIGLSFGSKDKLVKKVMLALDVDATTIQEAKENHVDLIFTHHPAVFKAPKLLNSDDTRRQDYIELIKSDIAVYSAHTNIDAAENGMSDWLADALSFPENRSIVSTIREEFYKKIAVYVPVEAAEKLRTAMHEAGAGEVGQYNDVSYDMLGVGHFTPSDGAHPDRGEVGESETVEELRIEMLFPESIRDRVIQSILTNHPYEEPVYDLYTIENQKKAYGFGRIAPVETTTEEMITQLKETFNLSHLRYAGQTSSRIHKKVAIFGGSGENYYKEALAQGATLFITGDVSYHGAQDMLRDGMDVIDPGHFIESIFVPKMKEQLNQWKNLHQWDLEILEARLQKDVFKFS